MKIQDVQYAIKGLDPKEARRTDLPKNRAAEGQSKSEDGDTLDLSLSARVSAFSAPEIAELADEPDALTPERAAEIRDRIESGYYTQPATTAAVAERLLSFYGR